MHTELVAIGSVQFYIHLTSQDSDRAVGKQERKNNHPTPSVHGNRDYAPSHLRGKPRENAVY